MTYVYQMKTRNARLTSFQKIITSYNIEYIINA